MLGTIIIVLFLALGLAGVWIAKTAWSDLFGIIMATLFALVFGYFVMLLWNWLMPDLFNLQPITYWQAFGIILLARLIFGGFKHGRDHDHDHDSHFKRKFIKKTGLSEFKKWNDWKYYDDFWKEKGKAAYKEYVEKKESEENDANLRTCDLRGWIEPIENAIPKGKLTPDNRLPDGDVFTSVGPIYRITDSGWAKIQRTYTFFLISVSAPLKSASNSLKVSFKCFNSSAFFSKSPFNLPFSWVRDSISTLRFSISSF